MTETVVTFEKTDSIGYITLNRPPANSYEINFMRNMDAAVDAAAADDEVRVVVVRSASEKFFCAGADIKAFLANSTEANMHMIEVGHAVLSKMAATNKIFHRRH